MYMSLAVSVARCKSGDPEVAVLVMSGHLDEALRIAALRTSRAQQGDPTTQSLRMQMMGRTMLALAREQEAQEHFQSALKVYDQVSRDWLRWCSSLDQGWTSLCMDRPGRAIEHFRTVVEDSSAPVEMVIEAMHGAADALISLGECSRALNLIDTSIEQCSTSGLADLGLLAQCHRMELQTTQLARRSEELSDHALATGFRDHIQGLPSCAELRRDLAQSESEVLDRPLVTHRLQHLQLMLTCISERSGTVELFSECMAWLKQRRLGGLEIGSRIQTAIALLARGNSHAAGDMLAVLNRSETQTRSGRYSMDIQYCMSKLYLMQGQVNDSMRAYKQHVEEAIYVIKRDLAQARRLAPGVRDPADAGDAVRQRLPLKYRGAYQFIVDHLSDPDLSVKIVAAQAGVTERSLQMAFRTHLGLTPAEFIRRHRMERIRDELKATGGHGTKISVQEVAARWGVSNRSTLAQNYRQMYTESPSQTLNGRSRRS